MNETPAMKKLVYIVAIAFFTVSITSCGSATNLQKEQKELAGYTLKNKKELFQQKVLHTNKKTVLATP